MQALDMACSAQQVYLPIMPLMLSQSQLVRHNHPSLIPDRASTHHAFTGPRDITRADLA